MKTDAIDNYVYDLVDLMLHILLVCNHNVCCKLKIFGWEHWIFIYSNMPFEECIYSFSRLIAIKVSQILVCDYTWNDDITFTIDYI